MDRTMGEKLRIEMTRNEPLHVSNCATSNIDTSDHSHRTKEGIARYREQGREWGANGKKLAKQNIEKATAFAESHRPLLIELGSETPIWGKGNKIRATGIARELNDRGIPTQNGGKWHPTSVGRLLKLLGQSLRDEIELIRAIRESGELAKLLPPEHPFLKSAIARRESLEKGMIK
jgi:hypothetical protein